MDRDSRQRERAAALGDTQAARALRRMRQRAGLCGVLVEPGRGWSRNRSRGKNWSWGKSRSWSRSWSWSRGWGGDWSRGR